MNIYITNNNDYLLLTEDLDKSTLEDYYSKVEMINNAMDALEEYKLKLEELKRINHPVNLLKFCVKKSLFSRLFFF